MDSDPTPHQDSLKDSLVNGKITLIDFLDALLVLDQEELTHPHSVTNVQLLKDPAVRDIIDATEDPRVKVKALQDAGLYMFHVAQRLAETGDPQTANTFGEAYLQRKAAMDYVLSLMSSADDALRSFIDQLIKDETPFLTYMQATASYMKGNLAELKDLYNSLVSLGGDETNTKIVGNLLHGLEQRGTPNYTQDYHV